MDTDDVRDASMWHCVLCSTCLYCSLATSHLWETDHHAGKWYISRVRDALGELQLSLRDLQSSPDTPVVSSSKH